MGAVWLQVVVTMVALGLGSWVALKPRQAIEIQKRFYLLINWRMEPVSMAVEIRNTKWMGMFLLSCVALIWIWKSMHFR